MTVHAVCSIEANTKTVWSAELLAYSWRRCGQTDPLTVLCAGGMVEIEGAEVIETESKSWLDGNHYPAYNKPCSIDEWVRRGGPQSDSILILDPDVVLLEPLLFTPAERGLAVGHGPWDWIGITSPEVKALSTHPELVASVGIPLLLHKADLQAVLSGWVEHTMALRRERPIALYDPWTVEMVGYSLAAADQGIRHQIVPWGRGPLLHYFGASPGALFFLPWTWNKYSHHAWDALPEVPKEAPEVARRFAALYEEYRQLKGEAS
jgi:hypothetical protein